tara:strand:+ start:258 stop:716 length:459 start_codon:yes stop_codon:yes gene_type:complete
MISIQHDDFNLASVYEQLRANSDDAGAIVLFSGLVREIYAVDSEEQSIQSLYLEHYPGMTEKSLNTILDRANAKWKILDARIIHRIGVLKPTDQIVLVGIASRHRQDAFDAARYIMDFLKSEAPFWKKQSLKNSNNWVESRESDIDALKSWE